MSPSSLSPARAPERLAGSSREIERVREIVARIAPTPRTTVLVTGEPGSGKESVARAIHLGSAGAEAGSAGPGRPFAALRCAGLTDHGLSAALAGAAGGTLFLDEVADLDIDLQARLARFLAERRTGSGGPADDVRVVGATSRDLEALVLRGRFDEELHYRLNVLSVRVPALRERAGDIPELAARMLAELETELGRALALTPGAVERLVRHAWPGNLRELRCALELAALRTAGSAIEADALPLPPAAPAHEPDAAADRGDGGADLLPLGDRSLRSMEEALIRRVLVEVSNNRSRAARVLGINRATLYNKLELYRI